MVNITYPKKLLDELNPPNVLSKETLVFLSHRGVSYVEAIYAISLTYGIPLKAVEDFVLPDEIFPYLDLTEAFYQSIEYGEGIEDELQK